MGRVAQEARLQAVVGGRGHHQLSDRRGVVEHEAVLGLQPGGVHGLGTVQRALLAGGEQQLDAHGRAVGHEPARGAEHRGHGGLVVRAEDALVGVAESAALLHHVHRGGQRNGVQVGAQQDRACALGPLDAREQVAGVRARVGAAVSSSTSSPISRSSAVTASATARSLSDGLSISHRRTKSAISRSRSGGAALRTAALTGATLLGRAKRSTRRALPAPPRERGRRRVRAHCPRSPGTAAVG